MQVFGLWDEVRVPGENPHKHTKNIQTPHRSSTKCLCFAPIPTFFCIFFIYYSPHLYSPCHSHAPKVNMPWGTWCTVCLEAATTTTAVVGEEAEEVAPTATAGWWGRPCRMTPSRLSAARCMRSSPRTWRTPKPWGTLAASRSSLASPAARETSKPNGKTMPCWWGGKLKGCGGDDKNGRNDLTSQGCEEAPTLCIVL